LVVAYGDLWEYFVLASNTCDASGEGRKPYLCVLPYVPFAHGLRDRKAPLGLATRSQRKDQDRWVSVLGFLRDEAGVDLSSVAVDELPRAFRDAVKELGPPLPEADIKLLRKVAGDTPPMAKRNYAYWVPGTEAAPLVPDGYVDFVQVCMLSNDRLQGFADRRIATLRSPYREQFSHKLGNYLSRVAVPTQAP
jgi:hypothetical protein